MGELSIKDLAILFFFVEDEIERRKRASLNICENSEDALRIKKGLEEGIEMFKSLKRKIRMLIDKYEIIKAVLEVESDE